MGFKGQGREGRRSFVQALGVTGFGVAVGGAIPLTASGEARHDAPSPATGEAGAIVTRVQEVREDSVNLQTGPIQLGVAGAEGRVGVCFLVAGGRRGAKRSLLLEVGSGAVVGPGSGDDLAGAVELVPDQGVERNVYRLLDALDTVRPVELFGLSTTVVPGPGSVWIDWSCHAANPGLLAEEIRANLGDFHAVVVGELSTRGTFRDRLSYTRISRVN